MGYTLKIYRSQDKVLAVHVDDPHEYSAIYLLNDGQAEVASNLADINGDVWDELEWHHALMALLLQDFDLVLFIRGERLPEELLEQHGEWLEQARS